MGRGRKTDLYRCSSTSTLVALVHSSSTPNLGFWKNSRAMPSRCCSPAAPQHTPYHHSAAILASYTIKINRATWKSRSSSPTLPGNKYILTKSPTGLVIPASTESVAHAQPSGRAVWATFEDPTQVPGTSRVLNCCLVEDPTSPQARTDL